MGFQKGFVWRGKVKNDWVDVLGEHDHLFGDDFEKSCLHCSVYNVWYMGQIMMQNLCMWLTKCNVKKQSNFSQTSKTLKALLKLVLGIII